MRPVSELYGRHHGEDIYVIGTGTSLRVFPVSFLENKVTIGLNMAWKTVPVRYAITIHPDLNIPEFIGAGARPDITWITPYQKTRALVTAEQFAHADAHFYYFDYDGRRNTQPPDEPSDAGRFVEWALRPTGNKLYVWSSIAQTGANLAANLGAKNVILVGCDSAPLAGNHHAHEQHTRWKGVDPSHRYTQYYEGMAELRAALRQRGVSVVSLQPFLGVTRFEHDYVRLCTELGRRELIETFDISPKIGFRTLVSSYARRFANRITR